jgi:hypothetical protein
MTDLPGLTAIPIAQNGPETVQHWLERLLADLKKAQKDQPDIAPSGLLESLNHRIEGSETEKTLATPLEKIAFDFQSRWTIDNDANFGRLAESLARYYKENNLTGPVLIGYREGEATASRGKVLPLREPPRPGPGREGHPRSTDLGAHRVARAGPDGARGAGGRALRAGVRDFVGQRALSRTARHGLRRPSARSGRAGPPGGRVREGHGG